MSTRILVIHGHPDSESFCTALAAAYRDAARATGAEVRDLVLADLTFEPNLRFGYRQRTELEPCLIAAQADLVWAQHVVLVHPVWWGSVPGLLKGFLDRVLLPGFAFKKRPGSVWWDKLLTGKTGRIISTLDQPGWYYRMRYGSPSSKALKRLTFEFCGIAPTRVTLVGPIRLSTDQTRAAFLRRIARLGARHR